jgi:tripartite ATP-independent transporter DctM subunit
MELYFLALLVLLMATALGSGYPVAFALPGSAIITISLAAATGYLFTGSTDAYFFSGGPQQWLSAGVTNLRGVYWEVERDTLIAIPLFIFMGIMLQRSKIAEDLLVTMAQLFGPVPGGLGISVVFVGALLAATTGIVGATVVAMGLISLPAMLRNKYSPSLATGTIAASGTLGQIIPPSIVLIILADQLASATDQASTMRKVLYKQSTGELSMPSAFDVGSTSAGEMFLGAFVPGIVLVLLYMTYILIYAWFRPSAAPAISFAGKFDFGFWRRVALTLIPPLALIFLVLGSIITGVATVNQAGAIGAAGAMIMAGYRLPEGNKGMTFVPAILAIGSLAVLAFVIENFDMNLKSASSARDWLGIQIGLAAVAALVTSLIWSGWRVMKIDRTLHSVMLETAKTTSLVFIILLGAAMLTAAFRAFGGEELVRNFLNSLPGGFWSKFVIVMAVIFLLGFFLDFIEIAVVVVPIVAPILLADPSANITAVWLGVMIGLNIQTSFLTPPFGFALFYLRGVAPPSVRTVEMYKGVVAFIGLQLFALTIVGAFPPLVNYLPNRVSFLSETSPPPRNPKLQQCLEVYVRDQVVANGPQIIAAIATARRLDLSILPKRMAADLTGAFDSADAALTLLDEIFVAEAAVKAATDAYRPKLGTVRDIEKKMLRIETEAAKLRKTARYMIADEDAGKRQKLEERILELDNERTALEAIIPATWDDTYTTFGAITAKETKARQTYRRAADNSVDPVASFLTVLAANAEFAALEDELNSLAAVIAEQEPKQAEATVKALGKKFGSVAGASDVASALSKARRSLRVRSLDREKAAADYAKALGEYADQLVWRAAAEKSLKTGVETYLAATSENIGARQQSKLSRQQALFLARCSSSHRDLSLSF